MTINKLLDLMVRHIEMIRTSFSAGRLTELRDRMRQLQAAGDDETARNRALRDIRKMLLLNLPTGNELREWIREEKRAAPAGLLPDTNRLTEVMALLESVVWPQLAPESAQLARAAQQRLLGVPARGADQLTVDTARDPVRAGLIRLTDRTGVSRFPDFQFDPDTGEPRAVVQRINRLLLADEDPWGVADWWLGGNVWLAGPPADLLGEVPDDLLVDAARALVEDPAW